MKKIAHILGNGPSRSDFVNEPEGDIYGCNLSDFSLPLKATFIMDKVAIDHIHNNRVELPWPIVVPTALRRLIQDCPTKPAVHDWLPDGLYNGESTGHYALSWCMKRYDVVHMWGFDSIWKDTVESDSHTKIPTGIHCAKNFKPWRENFARIFKRKDLAHCKVVMHEPK